MDTTGPAVSSRQRRPSTLSRAQDLAFRLSQTENVAVSGGFGSGKTFLANAIALYTVQAGASCLLVGPDRYLDIPASFQNSRRLPLHSVGTGKTSLDHSNHDLARSDRSPS